MKNPKTQKLLKKLISEEWIAAQMYKFYMMAMSLDCNQLVDETFADIMNDEMDDHLASLVAAAKKWGYDVPKTVAEFEKFADERVVKLYKSVKAEADLNYYIVNSIESEKLAISSYEEALSQVDAANEAEAEVRMAMLNAYYDELEHLERFGFINFVDNLKV